MGSKSVYSVLDLTAQAVRSTNFQLSEGKYEHQILRFSDPVLQQELLLKRADALAFDGKLSEAFETYQKASEFYRLRPVQLENLLQCLSGTESDHHEAERPARSGHDTFACGICFGFLYEPVTLLCGHCFCKKCLERERLGCKVCKDHSKETEPHKYRVNVVLSNLLVKWFPSQVSAVRLRREGNGLYAERRLEDALGKYNQAVLIAPKDHVLYANRSQINSSLKKFEDALSDADMACKLKPLWAKGHTRRAQVLSTLGKQEEALTEYLLSITLDHENEPARIEAQKLLSDLLVPVRECVRKKILDCTTLASSRTRVLSPNFGLHGPIMLQRSYKDFKIYINSSVSQSGGSRASSGIEDSCNRKACCKRRSVPDGPACITDQGRLRKRSHGTEDDGKAASGAGACKRYKLDNTGPQQARAPLRVQAPPCNGGEQSKVGHAGHVTAELIDPADLECSLCMRLFYEPVTTPCGHTFCLKCLERCLDHNPSCPLCKEDLSEYLAQRRYCRTFLTEDIISKYLPAELVDRQKVDEEELAELSNLNKNVPIFVCTMAFPTVPCPLHIFEPCYRLMIRRCTETGTRQFGMCLSDPAKGFADYGCMLEIRNVEFFADGCSIVDTIGRRRFRVTQHSQRDGYNTADIEYLEDIQVTGDSERELQVLHDVVYDQALVWVNSLQAEQRQRIERHFGSMPQKDSETQASPNGPSWCWWLLAVLPLEGRAQLSLLALTSLKDRLTGIRRVLALMSRSRSP